MQAKTISLLQLRQHVRALDKLIADAWLGASHPAEISFADLRKHTAAIAEMVADDEPGAPHAATATQPPKAATDNEAKKDAQKRAALQRSAADKATIFDPGVLGLSHIRRS